MMEQILSKGGKCINFIDDIIIFEKIEHDHDEALKCSTLAQTETFTSDTFALSEERHCINLMITYTAHYFRYLKY